GVFVPFGQSAEWDKNGPFRGVAPYFAELFTLDVNPTVAYRVNDKFSIAAGVNIIMSEIQSKQLLVDPANPAAPALNARAEGDGDALGWNLGAAFEPAAGHKVALAYRSGFEVEYDGDTAISPSVPPFLARSGFSSEIEFPHIVSAGYGMEVAEG
ncbi:MAG: hypothetical protein GWM98_09315, partial [Nitrospinaceae bacterium]|nr:hypothetical protein [Nitrospinaceae bacterium]